MAPEYKLIYWPELPGRAEFIRLLFEEADVSYGDTGKGPPEEAVSAVTGIISPNEPPGSSNAPLLAPPVLQHGRLVLSQTANILLYLAPRLGLGPKDGDGLFRLNGIVLTLLDGFVNEVHETHHPIAVQEYYENQRDEARRRSKAFREQRLPKFMAFAQHLLEADSSGEGPWLYGGRLTYADLVLFQGIDGTSYAFPRTMKRLKESGKYDGVFRLYEAVKKRPRIAEYLASDRRAKYSTGIWRHYPELEEE
ncbi:Glutathione S-transferase protein [Ophiocordyceps camponoti-floridani]|uniref:Glutathione S-transferase protein n=1 Tax=Ophiocordyceps camponoti-floridani TaxID=2030778 RepID=A0A8H4VBC1_9HYPO|nr:Glutathione S-transferase protein [Ophiocordyceps camponoti-floridani]